MTTVYNRNNVLNKNGASENVKTKKIEALPLWENTIAHNYNMHKRTSKHRGYP